MKRSFLLFAVLAAAGCGSSAPTSAQAGGPEVGPNPTAEFVGGAAGQVRVGGRYWTRTNLRIVKGTQIDFESWLSGEFLAMGTPVTLTEAAKGDTRWHVKTDDGRDFWIIPGNGGGYKDKYQEIQKFLAAADPKAGFDAGSAEVADGIKFARPVVGMTKAQVVAACGFPPKVTDPGSSDQWLYPQWGAGWRTHGWGWYGARSHNATVEFNAGKVVRVNSYENE